MWEEASSRWRKEASRPVRRVEAAEEVACDAPHGVEIVNGTREGAGSGDRGEVGVADLDADRAALCILLRQGVAELLGQSLQLRLEFCQPSQVVVERGLS